MAKKKKQGEEVDDAAWGKQTFAVICEDPYLVQTYLLVVFDKQLSSMAKNLYAALAAFIANDYPEEPKFPGADILASMLNITPGAYARAFKELIDRGLISIEDGCIGFPWCKSVYKERSSYSLNELMQEEMRCREK